MPILTDELPAPLALTELSVCSCKTKCATNKCKCRKNVLQSTDICKSGDCKNGNVHDAADNELAYLITKDEENA